MSTTATEVKLEISDFLHFKKTGDWRYKIWEKLRGQTERTNTLYWIGAIEVGKITETGPVVSIKYVNNWGELEKDFDTLRDVDGAIFASGNTCETRKYNLGGLHKKLVSTATHSRFYNVFVKEEVYHDGSSKISLLPIERGGGVKDYGFFSDEPWIEVRAKELFKKINCVSDCSENVRIFDSRAYNWLK